MQSVARNRSIGQKRRGSFSREKCVCIVSRVPGGVLGGGVWVGFVWVVGGVVSNLFSRGFREGISFPKFVERSILKLPLSKLCAVPLPLQNRAFFEGRKGRKRCREKGRKRGDQQRGQKEKRTRENRSGFPVENELLQTTLYYLVCSPSESRKLVLFPWSVPFSTAPM